MNLFGRVVVVIAKLKVVWKAWDVRSFILASFLFQIFLILITPFRKRTPSYIVRISTWIAYLLADWVAAQAVGLIAKVTQVFDSAETDLFGLWAQFLLLHLGGPDTITALALEDNALWLRTALHLGTQAYATLGILVRSVKQSTLWIATVLMFFAGIIKYMERVMSLQNGRLLDIVDPNEKYNTEEDEEDEEEDEEEQSQLSNAAMVRYSYMFFKAYKSLFSDIQPDEKVLADTPREFFGKVKPDEAYKMVQIQLNFTYEAMYTKMGIMHKTSWRILRHVVLSLQVASLVIWCLWDKQHFRNYDVGVTYTLLIGAIAVDLVGFVRVQLSDWNVALRKKESSSKGKILSICDLITCNASRACRGISSWIENEHLSRNRWSIGIGLYNGHINYGSTFVKYLATKLHPDSGEHSRGLVEFDREINSKWCFIFEMLTNPNKQQSYELSGSGMALNINDLLLQALPIHILDYGMILQFWFKVTINMDGYRSFEGPDDVCFILSNYMMYLMSFRPDMMVAAAGKSVIDDWKKENILDSYMMQDRNEYREREGEIVNDRKESGLGLLAFESDRGGGGQGFAMRQMRELRDYIIAEKKRDVLARIWAELVCHAAINCRPRVHAEKLKEGGEFLTFVWLLMVHLGIKARTLA